MSPSPTIYAPVQKWLHWLTAVIILVLVPVGIIMSGRDPGPVTNRLYELHKSLGLVVFGLALTRIVVRLGRGAPALDPDLPAWQKAAARLSHAAIYGLIVLVPLAGWAATSACCPPVNLFWTVPVTLPVAGGMDTAKAIFAVHEILAFTLVGLVAIHAGAALHHHLVRRDDTLRRMLPVRRHQDRPMPMAGGRVG